jgi:hypothetical protein
MYYVYQSLTFCVLILIFTQGGPVVGLIADTLAWRPVVTESSADPLCRDNWVPGARNDIALRCYMTKNVARFCQEEERYHLAWLISEYMAEEKAYEDALLGYVSRTAIGMNFGAKNNQDVMKQLEEAQRKAAEPLLTPDFKKAMMAETLLDREVTALFRSAVKNGLLVRDDLNWTIPSSIEAAFEVPEGKAAPKPAACRDQA